MKSIAYAICLGVILTSVIHAADPPTLDPHLEPLRPLLDKTYRGEFKNSPTDKPLVDVMRWERALNGKAIRILHSLNDGMYGGESIIRWDSKKQAIVYHYFTTADFTTSGTMTCEGKKITTLETVEGNTNGITEVRGTTEIQADGKVLVQAEHMAQGKWQPGRETLYTEDPSAKIVFK